ncbi:MAG: TAT-variant-translocated molybdopterin oxidoreductase [Flammeovirgaceae bacterium]|nr:TAT-variant-translocated molybdopterin oxidoreductase [Flammeovirgaceae bacterium]
MSKNKKTYWKGLEQLRNDPEYVKHADKEFVDLSVENDPRHSRRDFLKMMGFSVTAVSLAACEAPIRKAIPYVNKPLDVEPSIPNYYASTYINGGDYCSVVVKTREGRPIKVDGNSLSSVTMGGTSAQVEASVLSLYDNYRLRGPKIGADNASWEDLDKEIISKLSAIAAKGGQIRIVSNTILSPSTKAAIAGFKEKYSTTEHVQYDQNSCYGIAQGNAESFGGPFIPSYDFSKAKVIASVGADFLGTWLSPIEFAKQYSQTRKISEDKSEMSTHFHFESNLSLTGANADYRTMIKPSQAGLVVAQLHNLIAAKAGASAVGAGIQNVANLSQAADALWANKGKSLVVCGVNDKAVQVLVNAINSMLGNYGTTILTNKPVNFRQGNDAEMNTFVSDLQAGKIDGVIFYNCNPVYDHPSGAKIAEGITKASLVISTSLTEDETSTASGFKAPDHHYLESWNDAEPRRNSFSLSQPVISPIFKSRQVQESLMVWAGMSAPDYFKIVKNNWKNWFYANANSGVNFETFWDKCLYDGVYEKPEDAAGALQFAGDVNAAGSAVSSTYKAENTGFELAVYESYGVGNGTQANNPLLQELPDPITKAVWDHYVTISQKDATQLGITCDAEGRTQLVNVSANGHSVKIPALIQPGQAYGTLGIAIGYGRTKVGRVGENIGANAYPFLAMVNGSLNGNVTSNVSIENTGESFQIAQTQIHQTYMGRGSVIQESVLEEFKQDPYAGREFPKISKWDEKVDPGTVSLWKGHDYNNHHWGMAIDLNSCNGCGACIVACNVENNVAIVGKDEVIRRREMHWLRIDRYYSSDGDEHDYNALEKASENPEVVFQPMLCQHCNNASCETVCPVAATTHSTEGLNMMAYNRCIGTRYCANNCPYKVRRFNWFKYHDNQKFYQSNPSMNTDLGRMVLNPDVTVRSRGVMEKCSFCVQRIQASKLEAKKERRTLKDGEVVTACQASCTSGAILFGDMADPTSKVSQLLKVTPNEKRPHSPDKNIGNPRAYRVLEEIGVKPNIYYLTKIRNKIAEKSV